MAETSSSKSTALDDQKVISDLMEWQQERQKGSHRALKGVEEFMRFEVTETTPPSFNKFASKGAEVKLSREQRFWWLTFLSFPGMNGEI